MYGKCCRTRRYHPSVCSQISQSKMVDKRYLIGGGVVTCLLIITIVLLAVLLPQSKNEESGVGNISSNSSMLDMLDAMQQLMMGSGEYDRLYYSQLRSCMENFDPRLEASQDGAWQGMIDYWNKGGTVEDPWGGYQTHYLEKNVTQTDYLNMDIYEPCNYASNMATYRVSTEICARKLNGTAFSFSEEYVNALGSSFAALAYGSSLMHGSHTWLGHLMDNAPISVVSYLIHQASLAPLTGASSILTDLSPTPRNLSALQLSEEFLNMYHTMPVDEWYDHINGLDIPDYYYTFGALTATALNMAFNESTTELVIVTLGNAFNVTDDLVNFILDDYLSELQNLTANVNLGPLEHTRFIGNFLSSLIKLIYAFLWQEQRLTDNDIFLDPEVNGRGWELLPAVNAFANALNSFDYADAAFQEGTDIYPGDVWCNPVWPHAKWHLESAIGLLDLTYTGDEIHRLLSENNQ